ncbi:5-aminovalerate aminotransferase DavT [Arthrobacter sp. Hiyo1]|nr:5-aminovalerate aminotransferase DavT [Arthrobacter sp. Hiyo1]
MTSLSPVLKQATPVVVDHALGSWIFGTDGEQYLDFTTGIGVTSTGHCHPKVVAAAREQVGKIIHAQYTTVMHKPLLELTEKLGEVLPAGLDSVFYANSGSEAVEAAIRLARMATGRPNIVVFQGGFHGRTVAAASLTTAGTKFSAGFAPLMAGVHMSVFPHMYRYGMDEASVVAFALRELDYLFKTRTAPEDTAAFLIEPALGDGGYIPTPPAFMDGLRERANRHGIQLIFDEVQAASGARASSGATSTPRRPQISSSPPRASPPASPSRRSPPPPRPCPRPGPAPKAEPTAATLSLQQRAWRPSR